MNEQSNPVIPLNTVVQSNPLPTTDINQNKSKKTPLKQNISNDFFQAHISLQEFASIDSTHDILNTLKDIEDIGKIDTDELLGDFVKKHTEGTKARACLSAFQNFSDTIQNHTDLGIKIAGETTEFLNRVLPSEIVEDLKMLEKFEELQKLFEMGSTIIGLLNNGYKGAALVVKTRSLFASKKLLGEVKQKIENDLLAKIQAAGNDGEKVAITNKSTAILNRLRAWNIEIEIEQRLVNTDWAKYGITITSTLIDSMLIPLKWIPKHLHPSEATLTLSKQILGGLGWTLRGLEVIILGIELHHKNKEDKVIKEWINAFEESRKVEHPVFKIEETEHEITEITRKNITEIKRKNFKQGFIKDPLTSFDHKQNFLKLIRDQEFSMTQKILQVCGIKLENGIDSKEKLQDYLTENPEIETLYFEHYLEMKRNLESLELVIQTSPNLINKRQAIGKKKQLELALEFDTLEPKIKEVATSQFKTKITSLKNLLERPEPLTKGTEVVDLTSKFLVDQTTLKAFDDGIKNGFFINNSEFLKTYKAYKTLILEMNYANPKQLEELDRLKKDMIQTLRASINDRKTIEKSSITSLKILLEQPEPVTKGTELVDLTTKFLVDRTTLEVFDDGIKNGFFINNSKFLETYDKYNTLIQTMNYADPQKLEELDQLKRDMIERLTASINDQETFNKSFNEWYNQKNTDDRLNLYIDHKNTIALSVKAPLIQSIQNKQAIEKKIANFRLKSAKGYFGAALIGLGVSGVFTILAIAGTPVAAAGLVLFLMTIATTAMSLTFITMGYYLSLKYHKRSTIDSLTRAPIQSLWRNSRLFIKKTKANIKLKSLQKKQKWLNAYLQLQFEKMNKNFITDTKYIKAKENLLKAKASYEESLKEVEHWTERTEALQSRSIDYAYKDFADSVNYNDDKSFNTLDSTALALSEIDEELIDNEMKNLLIFQLGIDIKTLQSTLNKNPNAVLEATKTALKIAFGRAGIGLISFWEKQQKKAEQGLISLK